MADKKRSLLSAASSQKAEYLQSIGAPAILDRLVQALLEEAPTADGAPAVLRSALDKMYPESKTNGSHDCVCVRIDRNLANRLQEINPKEAEGALKHLRERLSALEAPGKGGK
eukprot:Sspe_Gene.62045::Locus_34618_Transcript_1_1_Confidence_1.000_Length_484::g.62045::m.62045